MTTSSRSLGLRAALALLPSRAEEINRLFERDERFRGICDDLGDADEALKAVDQLPEMLREERRAEYETLIDDLKAEIEADLLSTKVISIAEAKRRHDS